MNGNSNDSASHFDDDNDNDNEGEGHVSQSVNDQNGTHDDTSSSPSTSAAISDILRAPFFEDGISVNEYMFESDHAALKGNEDYQNLLNDLVMFEAKRIQALKDMNSLIDIQETALQEPIEFVNKLQNRVNLGIPKPIEIPQPLLIEWDKYTAIPEHLIGMNRRLSIRKLCGKLENAASETGSNPDSNHPDDESAYSAPTVVRGRVKDENKPETFNQLWTVDEQKRLEELLLKHPPEEVESKRYQKIATALGNRTPTQVQSRIQKYFIKLAKAGLPVPGRVPKKESRCKKIIPNTHPPRDRYYLQPSTFLQSHQPPVYMSDDDEVVGSCMSRARANDETTSEEEDVPAQLRATEEYRELMRLKRLRHDRQIERLGESNQAQHIGYKCDRCEMNPIRGTRWNCQDCPDDVSIDLCSLCADSTFELSNHDSRHRLVPVHTPLSQSHIDNDYLRFAPSGYNYLDPNYMPAT